MKWDGKVQRLFVRNATAVTDQVLVAAVPERRIKVVQLILSAGGTSAEHVFESGTATRIYSLQLISNAVVNLFTQFEDVPLFETAVGEALTYTFPTMTNSNLVVLYVVE
jgi:hypothetical protein